MTALVSGFFVANLAIAETTINVGSLEPSWTATGGGGVYSAYYGPDNSYAGASPGTTTVYDGREAGVIKAGFGPYPGTIDNWDEGLFGFKPTVTIDAFAAGAVTYDVENQYGENPVWMTIEVDTGIVDYRSDNTTYQFVPTTNPAGWHTVNAAAGQWQLMDDNGNGVGPLMTLSEVAVANTGLNVVRAYLRLGMGDSYHGTAGLGTVAWVDKITLSGVTYDFVDFCVDNILDVPSEFDSIQGAIDHATVSCSTVKIAAGTYSTTGQIVIDKDLTIIGTGGKPVIQPDADLPQTNNVAGAWFLVNPNMTFNLSNVALDGNGQKVYQAIRSHGTTTIDSVDFLNIRDSAAPYVGFAIASFGGTVPGGAGSDTHSSDGASSTLTVTNSTFAQIGRIGILIKGTDSTATITGNTYTGKGDGDFLDYAFEAGAGGSTTIENNTITDNRGIAASDGSTSAGILVTDYYGAGTSADITGNTITNSTDGIAVGYDGSDASIVVAHNNKFSGNDKAINSTGPSVDATNNYWGAASGPSEIGAGSGDGVSSNVTYRPWLLEADGDSYDQTIALTEAGQWALVSAPTLLSEAPSVVDDGVDSVALLAYEDGAWVTPGVENDEAVSAFYVKTINKGGVGFKYASGTPTQTSKQLTTGWNLVGTNFAGSAINEFSSILNTETTAGMVTLYAPDTNNSRKEAEFYASWGEDADHDLNANLIADPGWGWNNLSTYDGYWVFMNAAKAFVKNLY